MEAAIDFHKRILGSDSALNEAPFFNPWLGFISGFTGELSEK